ncbi:Crp/Fnr family transcriptional regulator, partial [Chloroflexota bacterium]
MVVQVEFLKNSPYFSGLDSNQLDSFRRFIFERTAERGEMLLVEGDPAKALYFVVAGVVKIFKTSTDGKEQILQLICPGESFNDVPVFSGSPNLAS